MNQAIMAVRKATDVFARMERHLKRRGIELTHMTSGGSMNTYFVGSQIRGDRFILQLDMTIDARHSTAGSRVRLTLRREEARDPQELLAAMSSGRRPTTHYTFLPRYRVYYDARRDEWRPDHQYVSRIPESFRIVGKLPQGRLTERNAMRLVDALADHFTAQSVTKPREIAKA